MCDPYDHGIPKYSTAQDIYDALCKLVQTEEMNILREIGADVSWDNQTYYYTERGFKLKEEFEKLSDSLDKIWLLDLAINQMQMDKDEIHSDEIHSLVYDALYNDDLAKRIGFKKIFVEHMLLGYDKYYAQIAEKYLEEINELDRFDRYSMMQAFARATKETAIGTLLYTISPYPNFAYHLSEKVRNLRMEKETRLIAECRAHLAAYDDFIFGLRINQSLYEQQEQSYRNKIVELQAAYNEKIKYLYIVADRAGVLPALNAELKRLEIGDMSGGKEIESSKEPVCENGRYS